MSLKSIRWFIWQVLNAGDDAVGLEQLEEDADDIALQKARRSVGSMSAMSGASGMVYMEYKYIIPSLEILFSAKVHGMSIIPLIAKTAYLSVLYFMLQWLFKPLYDILLPYPVNPLS